VASYDPSEVQIDLSAYRHGISESDIRHALAHPLMILPTEDDGFTISIGPARDGALLELGLVRDRAGIGVVHAMPARRRFLRGWLIR